MNLRVILIQNILSLLLVVQCQRSFTIAVSPKNWHALGNWIDEEGARHRGGYAVATSRDGSTIAMSAPYYAELETDDLVGDPIGSRAGRVVVYDYNGSTSRWAKLGEEIIGDPGDELGTSLAMAEDGLSLIVGMMSDNGDKKEAGKVQVYVLDKKNGDPIWIQKGQTLQGEQDLEQFGFSVDIADGGEVIAVGSPGLDVDGKTGIGAVRVYKFEGVSNKWEKVKADIVGDDANDHFGYAISLSQVGQVAIGAPFANNAQGYVQMVRYDSTQSTWVKNGKAIKSTDAKAGDKFGTSVGLSFDASSVAVGSPRHKGNGELKRSGLVTVHKYDGSSKLWKQVGDDLIGRQAGDEFGTSVSLSDDGTEVAIGSPYSGVYDKESGHITVYQIDGEKWQMMGLEIDGKSAYNHLGSSVQISGDGMQVIGGAPTEGYATVYMLSVTAPPTYAPTSEPKGDRGGGGGRSLMHFLFLVTLTVAIVYGIAKGVEYYRNRRALLQFEVAARHDLEMRENQQRMEWQQANATRDPNY